AYKNQLVKVNQLVGQHTPISHIPIVSSSVTIVNPLSTSPLSLPANISIPCQANQNNGNQDHNNENVISEETVIQSHMMSDEED
ncbi:804_t:CDS:2, partial [Funneliformis caledonium]